MKPDWYSNVQPKRRMREAGKPWACVCIKRDRTRVRQHPGYLSACPDCGERRPS